MQEICNMSHLKRVATLLCETVIKLACPVRCSYLALLLKDKLSGILTCGMAAAAAAST